MGLTSCLVLVAAVLAVIGFLTRSRRNPRRRLPPGPTPLPLLGNILQMDKDAPFESFVRLSERYGPVLTVYLGGQRTVVLVGYEAVRDALLQQSDDFTGRAPFPFLQRLTRGYGLAISNGRRWEQLRGFTVNTLRDLGMGRRRLEEQILEESQHLRTALEDTQGSPCDPTFTLSRAVSNVVSRLLFGQRFDYADQRFLRMVQLLHKILRSISGSWGQLYNLFPWLLERLPGPHEEIFSGAEEVRRFVEERVREHQETLSAHGPRDFIDCFLLRMQQEQDNPSSEFHRDNLVSTVLNLLLAGTETTSTTLRYALLLLIKYPHVQERAQREIDEVVGRERPPAMEDRRSLPFTDAVVHEVQRLLDVVPMSMPQIATRDISFRGYTIPKGTVVIPLLHSVLRDSAYWPSPRAFDPGHFLDQNGGFKRNPAFLPFSAGKRSCVGEPLARMELFLFLASLLQRFSFSAPLGPDSVDIRPNLSAIANLPRPYQLIARPR
ncbi:cytochrome P450 2F5-like isoform X2 [Lepisosteus oculatus]|uniref:cytochrome P450 2F5-like isoform X2 n=1 Tax=Lepisosteus oculatus TaxID=7918 RepID=UPI003723050A